MLSGNILAVSGRIMSDVGWNYTLITITELV